MCLDHLDQLKALSRKQLDDSLNCHEPLLGDWVVVEYDGNHFPGQVTEMHVETCQMHVPAKALGHYRWPEFGREEITNGHHYNQPW